LHFVSFFVSSRCIGIVQDSGSEGQKVRLALGGISPAHHNLIPGYKYYSNMNGDLTLQMNLNQLPFVGTAISDSQLLLNPNLLPGEVEAHKEEESVFDLPEDAFHQ
jgi:hypothetical protein